MPDGLRREIRAIFGPGSDRRWWGRIDSQAGMELVRDEIT